MPTSKRELDGFVFFFMCMGGGTYLQATKAFKQCFTRKTRKPNRSVKKKKHGKQKYKEWGIRSGWGKEEFRFGILSHLKFRLMGGKKGLLMTNFGKKETRLGLFFVFLAF